MLFNPTPVINYEVQPNVYVMAQHPVEMQVAAKKEEYKTTRHTVIKSEPSKLGKNCVEYARSKAHVPNGVGTLKQKQNKINTQIPSVGAVGVTAEGSVGHMVVIEQIKNDTLIISEGNYRHGFITWREIPKTMVLGYIEGA